MSQISKLKLIRTGNKGLKGSPLEVIFNFFTWNNQQIKERKLELQRLLSVGETEVEKELSFREKESL